MHARLFAAHQSHLDRTVNVFLSVYREANKRARLMPAPARFTSPYVLEKVPIEAKLVENSARDDLRRSITESQYSCRAVQAIMPNSTRLRELSRIHDVIEETPVARAYAKAR